MRRNLIMTAKQEMLSCNSLGYMLVYKASNVILETLGYQKNPICFCCWFFVIAVVIAFVIVKIVVALIEIIVVKKVDAAKVDFSLGGWCCFYEDGCCEGGCCDDCFCDCCCNEPCCEKGVVLVLILKDFY